MSSAIPCAPRAPIFTPQSGWNPYARKKRMISPPTMGESLEMAALSEAMNGVAFPATEIVKLFLAQNPHHPAYQQLYTPPPPSAQQAQNPNLHYQMRYAPTQRPPHQNQHQRPRCQCHTGCTAQEEPPVDAETEALLREMARSCQEYTETLRSSFARIEKGVREGVTPDYAGEHPTAGMRTLGPNAMAKMSEATRQALTKLTVPLINDPTLASKSMALGDEMEAAALRQPLGSAAAISLHGKAMAHRSMAFGIRSEAVAKSEQALGENYLCCGKLLEAGRSLSSAMSIRNEYEIDGEQRGSREDAAWTREVYGRVMEAKGDLAMARYVRLTGLEMGRVRCGWEKCKVLLGRHDFMSCSQCRAVFYCSAECQAHDWARHKKPCRVYFKKANGRSPGTAPVAARRLDQDQSQPADARPMQSGHAQSQPPTTRRQALQANQHQNQNQMNQPREPVSHCTLACLV